MTKTGITTILNCYRRPYYLKEQLEAIRNQTSKSDEVWLWVNYHDDNKDWDFKDYGFDKIITSNYNFKFHGRFAAANLVKTSYISILDDDTIPGQNWYTNCLDTLKETGPSILGGVGLVFSSNTYWGHSREGWPSENEKTVEVDLVGHAWFFPRQILGTFWISPVSLDNCEDLQLSYFAQKYAGIKTYCPPHPKNDKSLWSSLKPWELGVDSKSSSNGAIPHYEYFSEREYCLKFALANGWKTVNNVK